MSNINFNIEEKLNRPVLALRGLWIYPYSVVHFDAGRKKSIDAIETALKKDSILVVFTQKDIRTEDPKAEDLYEMGTVVIVKQILKMNNGVTRVLAEGICRCKAKKIYDDGRFLRADVEEYYYNEVESEDAELLTLRNMVEGAFEDYTTKKRHLDVDTEVSVQVSLNMDKFTNNVASYIMGLSDDEHFENFKIFDMRQRLEKLYEILQNSIELSFLEEKLSRKVSSRLNKNQREYYLREQLKAIQKELGDDEDINSEADEYREKLNKIKAPKETKEKIAKEINKFSKISPMSPDVSVSRTYLDTVFSLPWNKETRDKIDLEKAKEILDDEHYGLEKVKERILEYLAIRKLSKSLKSPIICLVGPPGVGKTSIAKSIADSLGRKFVRISLGGVRDEAEIRGHRRTYVGAIPGRIINGLKEAQTKNPVFLLDEIDKMSSDYKGDPASAMLEVLDPGQNKDFVDHYVEVPFDLSKILFVTTANSLSTIPRPLLDRMEIIEVSGYIEEEKLNIVKKYLLPKQLKEHALEADFIKMDDEVIRDIIDSYTREAGVRNLERTIGKICRKVAKKYVENPSLEGVVITKADLDEYLGKNRYRHQLAGTKPEVGIVTGLAWTAVGGETLTAEVNVLKGKGQVVLTGKLGTVMKESAQTGISYIRSIADRFDIDPDFYTKNDIHIHLPEGAVPKDGPSAGITMALAVLSALTNIPVRNNVAMTGEITLRGRVLAVGGIKEKLLAAHRAGITKVLLPKECEADLEEIPQNVKEQMEFVLDAHMDEVLEHALLRNGEQ